MHWVIPAEQVPAWFTRQLTSGETSLRLCTCHNVTTQSKPEDCRWEALDIGIALKKESCGRASSVEFHITLWDVYIYIYIYIDLAGCQVFSCHETHETSNIWRCQRMKWIKGQGVGSTQLRWFFNSFWRKPSGGFWLSPFIEWLGMRLPNPPASCNQWLQTVQCPAHSTCKCAAPFPMNSASVAGSSNPASA